MRAYFRHLTSQFIFLFGLVWALVGTPFLAVAFFSWRSGSELNKRGVSAEAILVEKTHTSGSKGSSYVLKYVFRDREGGEHVREAKVNWETWRRFEDGSKLPIVYLPDKPEKSRLGGALKEDWWIVPLVFGIFGVIFAPVGWFLLLLAVRRAIGAMELLMSGVIMTGQVLELREDLSTTINGRHPLFLVYRFRGPDGKEYEGQTSHLSRKLETRWQPGSSVAVVCDPANPSRHEADIFSVRLPVGENPARP